MATSKETNAYKEMLSKQHVVNQRLRDLTILQQRIIEEQQKTIAAHDFTLPTAEGFGPESEPLKWAGEVVDLVPIEVNGQRMDAMILWPGLPHSLGLIALLRSGLIKMREHKTQLERELIHTIDTLEALELQGLFDNGVDDLQTTIQYWKNDKETWQAQHKTIVAIEGTYKEAIENILNNTLEDLAPIIDKAQMDTTHIEPEDPFETTLIEYYKVVLEICENKGWQPSMAKGIGDDDERWGDNKAQRHKRRDELLLQDAASVDIP